MIKKIIKENYKYLLVLLFMIVFFVILKKVNNFEIFYNIDNLVSDFIKNNFSNNLHKLFNFTSDVVGIYTLILIIVCMFLKIKNKYYIYLTGSLYGFTLLISALSKNLVCRARPLSKIYLTMDKYSFPSGHTLMSFVMYLFIAYLLSLKVDKKTKIAYYFIASILIFTVAFSRLYLGVHHFTDVIASMLFGIVIFLMMKNIVNKNYKRKLV